jgi:hypothetical protein
MGEQVPEKSDATCEPPSRATIAIRVVSWLLLGGVAIALMSCGTCRLK